MSRTTATVHATASGASAEGFTMRSFVRMAGILAVVGSGAVIAAPADALRLDGMTVHTSKHAFTLDPSGLPQQIVIKADPAELPLESRTAGAATPDLLQALGRGDQLRQPMRLVAVIAGQAVTAVPVKPAQPRLQGGRVVVESELKAGDMAFEVKTVYLPSGRIDLTVTGGKGLQADAISLVLDLAGSVDTVIAGKPVADKPKVYGRAEFAVGTREGVIWANVGEGLPPGGRASPGVPEQLFVGNGDRGFTWLAESSKGFDVDKALPTMVLTRDKAGAITWRCHLLNHPARLDKALNVAVSLLIHPARSRAAVLRSLLWLNPPAGLPRADRVLDRDDAISAVSLEGSAGGDAVSAEQNLAVTYPISLFRYLAGTHTGLGARLRPNAASQVRSGGLPGPDRMALGRALLHDIGLDATGLAHLAQAAAVAKALDEFGYFKDDAPIEFIPYWRAGKPVRYGETFATENPFALTQQDPMTDVHVSVWRRATAGRGTDVLIVVVNESAEPVREQFYVTDVKRLFGGPNTAKSSTVISSWSTAGIPADSDWSQARMLSCQKGTTVLLDLIDRGFVVQAAAKDTTEVYGPLFVPAFGFRLLYGTGK